MSFMDVVTSERVNVIPRKLFAPINLPTGIYSQIGTKLSDWAVSQARASCYSQAALSSNDFKML